MFSFFRSRAALALAAAFALAGAAPAFAACTTDFAATTQQAHNGLYEMMENVCNALQNLTITGGGGGTGGGGSTELTAAGATVSLSAGTTSSESAIGGTSPTAWYVVNVGSVTAYGKPGTSSGVTASTTDFPLLPNQPQIFPVGSNTNFAVVTASGTTTVLVIPVVTIADQTLSALTNLGGCSSDSIASAATTNAQEVSSSARVVCSLNVNSTSNTIMWVRLYDTAATPTCSSATGFIGAFGVPPAAAAGQLGGAVYNFGPLGKALVNGLGVCITGGAGSADNTNATTGAVIDVGSK